MIVLQAIFMTLLLLFNVRSVESFFYKFRIKKVHYDESSFENNEFMVQRSHHHLSIFCCVYFFSFAIKNHQHVDKLHHRTFSMNVSLKTFSREKLFFDELERDV